MTSDSQSETFTDLVCPVSNYPVIWCLIIPLFLFSEFVFRTLDLFVFSFYECLLPCSVCFSVVTSHYWVRLGWNAYPSLLSHCHMTSPVFSNNNHGTGKLVHPTSHGTVTVPLSQLTTTVPAPQQLNHGAESHNSSQGLQVAITNSSNIPTTSIYRVIGSQSSWFIFLSF